MEDTIRIGSLKRELDSSSFYPRVLRGNYTNLEIVPYTKQYALESSIYSYTHGLSWLNIDACVDILRNAFKIDPDIPLLIRKQDFTSNFTNKQENIPKSSEEKISYGVSK